MIGDVCHVKTVHLIMASRVRNMFAFMDSALACFRYAAFPRKIDEIIELCRKGMEENIVLHRVSVVGLQ